MIVFRCLSFIIVILGHVFSYDPQTGVPSILKYRNLFTEDMVNRRGQMTIEEKRNCTLKYSRDHLFAIRFFEKKYTNSELIRNFPGYKRLQEDYMVFKYRAFLARHTWSYRYQKFREELLPQEQLEEWNWYRRKHKRFYQPEKWLLFTHWLMTYPIEWTTLIGNDGSRLRFLYEELQDATQYGLTPDTFTNCLINDWKTSSNIIRHQEQLDYGEVFENLLPTVLPKDVNSACFVMLEVVLNKYPLSKEEKLEYMNSWDSNRQIKSFW